MRNIQVGHSKTELGCCDVGSDVKSLLAGLAVPVAEYSGGKVLELNAPSSSLDGVFMVCVCVHSVDCVFYVCAR